MSNHPVCLYYAALMCLLTPAPVVAVEMPIAIEGDNIVLCDGDTLRRVPLTEENRKAYGVTEEWVKSSRPAVDLDEAIDLWLVEVKQKRKLQDSYQPPPPEPAPAAKPVKEAVPVSNLPALQKTYATDQLIREFHRDVHVGNSFEVVGIITSIKELTNKRYVITLDRAVLIEVDSGERVTHRDTGGEPRHLGKWVVGQGYPFKATCRGRNDQGMILMN